MLVAPITLKKRLSEHRLGKVNATKNRLPIKLIYCEICLNETDAYYREKYFKTGFGRRYLKERNKNFFKANGPRPPRVNE